MEGKICVIHRRWVQEGKKGYSRYCDAESGVRLGDMDLAEQKKR